jgi:hypothetical protein
MSDLMAALTEMKKVPIGQMLLMVCLPVVWQASEQLM